MKLSRAQLLSSPNLTRLLDPHSAKDLGLAIPPPIPQTPSPKLTGKLAKPSKPELQDHAEFLHWIKKLNRSLPTDKPLLAIHANPTTKSGIIPGWPDFTLIHYASSQPLFIEFKRIRSGRLSPAQSLIHRYLHALGHHVHIVFSSHDAVILTQSHFHLPP